jgi:hypothetical protein
MVSYLLSFCPAGSKSQSIHVIQTHLCIPGINGIAVLSLAQNKEKAER